jgi:hypothetical protein
LCVWSHEVFLCRQDDMAWDSKGFRIRDTTQMAIPMGTSWFFPSKLEVPYFTKPKKDRGKGSEFSDPVCSPFTLTVSPWNMVKSQFHLGFSHTCGWIQGHFPSFNLMKLQFQLLYLHFY